MKNLKLGKITSFFIAVLIILTSIPLDVVAENLNNLKEIDDIFDYNYSGSFAGFKNGEVEEEYLEKTGGKIILPREDKEGNKIEDTRFSKIHRPEKVNEIVIDLDEYGNNMLWFNYENKLPFLEKVDLSHIEENLSQIRYLNDTLVKGLQFNEKASVPSILTNCLYRYPDRYKEKGTEEFIRVVQKNADTQNISDDLGKEYLFNPATIDFIYKFVDGDGNILKTEDKKVVGRNIYTRDLDGSNYYVKTDDEDIRYLTTFNVWQDDEELISKVKSSNEIPDISLALNSDGNNKKSVGNDNYFIMEVSDIQALPLENIEGYRPKLDELKIDFNYDADNYGSKWILNEDEFLWELDQPIEIIYIDSEHIEPNNVDKSELEAKVKEAKSINTELYSRRSLKTLNEIIEQAEFILKNQDSSESQVKDILKKLDDSLKDLVEIKKDDRLVLWQMDFPPPQKIEKLDGLKIILKNQPGQEYSWENIEIGAYFNDDKLIIGKKLKLDFIKNDPDAEYNSGRGSLNIKKPGRIEIEASTIIDGDNIYTSADIEVVGEIENLIDSIPKDLKNYEKEVVKELLATKEKAERILKDKSSNQEEIDDIKDELAGLLKDISDKKVDNANDDKEVSASIDNQARDMGLSVSKRKTEEIYDNGKYLGEIYFMMETFTVNGDTIIEPIKIPLYEGESLSDRIDYELFSAYRPHKLKRVRIEKNSHRPYEMFGSSTSHSRYGIKGIKNIMTKDMAVDYPNYIKNYANENSFILDEDYDINKKGLFESDLYESSRWDICINNSIVENVSTFNAREKNWIGGNSFSSGDIIQIKFNLFGDNFLYESDIDKSQLIKELAEVNSYGNKKYLKDSNYSKVYDEAIKVLSDFEASQEEVDKLVEKLQEKPDIKEELKAETFAFYENQKNEFRDDFLLSNLSHTLKTGEEMEIFALDIHRASDQNENFQREDLRIKPIYGGDKVEIRRDIGDKLTILGADVSNVKDGAAYYVRGLEEGLVKLEITYPRYDGRPSYIWMYISDRDSDYGDSRIDMKSNLDNYNKYDVFYFSEVNRTYPLEVTVDEQTEVHAYNNGKKIDLNEFREVKDNNGKNYKLYSGDFELQNYWNFVTITTEKNGVKSSRVYNLKTSYIEYEINNISNPGHDIKEGDKFKLDINGFAMPLPKIGKFYNPLGGYRIRYTTNLPRQGIITFGKELKASTSGSIKLRNGHTQFSSFGASGDMEIPKNQHREEVPDLPGLEKISLEEEVISDAGGQNYQQISKNHYNMPDYEFEILENKDYRLENAIKSFTDKKEYRPGDLVNLYIDLSNEQILEINKNHDIYNDPKLPDGSDNPQHNFVNPIYNGKVVYISDIPGILEIKTNPEVRNDYHEHKDKIKGLKNLRKLTFKLPENIDPGTYTLVGSHIDIYFGSEWGLSHKTYHYGDFEDVKIKVMNSQDVKNVDKFNLEKLVFEAKDLDLSESEIKEDLLKIIKESEIILKKEDSSQDEVNNKFIELKELINDYHQGDIEKIVEKPEEIPNEKPEEEPGHKPEERPEYENKYVTISIDKKTINKDYTLRPMIVEIEDGDSVWDVLKLVAEQKDIDIEYEYSSLYDSVYIQSIDGDGEFDYGDRSGWMYNVNGKYPGYGASKYILRDGDIIQWRYTTNLGKDLGEDTSEWEKDDSSVDKESSSNGKLDRDIANNLDKLASKDIKEKDINKELDKIKDNISSKDYSKKSKADMIKDAEEISKVIAKIVKNIDNKIEGKKIAKNILTISEQTNKNIKDGLTDKNIKKYSKIISKNITLVSNLDDSLSDDIIELSSDIKERENKIFYSDIKNYEKTIELSLEDDLNVPEKLISKSIDKNVKKILLNNNDVSLDLNLSSLKEIDGNLKLNISRDKSNKVKVDLLSAKGKLKTLDKPVKIKIPCESENLVVKFEDGSLLGGVYDEKSKSIVFITNNLGEFTLVENSIKFKDLDKHKWAKESIENLASKGIVNGKSEGYFLPGEDITRAEFVSLINRVMGYELKNLSEIPFEDINIDNWYYEDISLAYELGYINGKNENTFDPEGHITREEISKIVGNILYKNYFKANSKEELKKYKDWNKVSEWAEDEVAMLIGKNLLKGDIKGHINPKANANRAESAVIIDRFYHLFLIN